MIKLRFMSISRCTLLTFPQMRDPRGSLTFIENNEQIPFTIQRVYYLYDITSGASRGGHAHKAMEQILISISGSFDVVVDDGANRKTFTLNRPFHGLYVPQMVWRELHNFSSGSVCLSLASTLYEEADYYRDYEEFLAAMRGKK